MPSTCNRNFLFHRRLCSCHFNIRHHIPNRQKSIAVCLPSPSYQLSASTRDSRTTRYGKKRPFRRQRQTDTPIPRPRTTDAVACEATIRRQRFPRPLPKYAMLELTRRSSILDTTPCLLHCHLGLKLPEFGFLVVLFLGVSPFRYGCYVKVSRRRHQ